MTSFTVIPGGLDSSTDRDMDDSFDREMDDFFTREIAVGFHIPSHCAPSLGLVQGGHVYLQTKLPFIPGGFRTEWGTCGEFRRLPTLQSAYIHTWACQGTFCIPLTQS